MPTESERWTSQRLDPVSHLLTAAACRKAKVFEEVKIYLRIYIYIYIYIYVFIVLTIA